MPAKTPVTLATLKAAPTTATWVNPDTGDFTAAGTLTRGDFSSCRHKQYYFSDIDDADTWTSGIPGIKHLAVTTTSAGAVAASLTTIATGVITFVASAADQTIILHVWSQSG
jgi:hypothetical protein